MPFRIGCVVALCLLSSQASADVLRTGKITRLVVERDVVSVWLANDAPASECQSDGRWVVSNNADEKTFKEKVATILAAASAGKEVGLGFRSADGCGDFGAKRIYYVDLRY